LFVLEDARLLALATACQAVRGERQPILRYGLSAVVDGDETSVHEVLGFSKDAVLEQNTVVNSQLFERSVYVAGKVS